MKARKGGGEFSRFSGAYFEKRLVISLDVSLFTVSITLFEKNTVMNADYCSISLTPYAYSKDVKHLSKCLIYAAGTVPSD